MGQKVSPEIFRIESLTSNWKSKYIENKPTELSTFFFKTLEIKNFVKRFLKFHGLVFHTCKIAISNNSLHLIFLYYATNSASIQIQKNNTTNKELTETKKEKIFNKKKETFFIIKNLINIYYNKYFSKITSKRKLRKKNKFKKKISFKYLYLKKKSKKKFNKLLGKFKKKKIKFNYLKKKFLISYNYFKKIYLRKQRRYIRKLIRKKIKNKRLRYKYFKKIKVYSTLTNHKNLNNIKKNNFKEIFLENISKFIEKKQSLFITIKNLKINNIKETYLIKDARFIKKKLFFKLYKYKKNSFLKTTKRIILLIIKKINSAQFLADFISYQLNRLKKEQYFFLKCIKTILSTLLKKTTLFTRLSGIKIIVKGRLKKARRAKNKSFKLIIGRVSLNSIKSHINHAKSTSYTSNGTFGTEIWINYFLKKKQI